MNSDKKIEFTDTLSALPPEPCVAAALVAPTRVRASLRTVVRLRFALVDVQASSPFSVEREPGQTHL